MTELAHQPCPYTDCGSSDAFSFNEEGYGLCHSCGRSYPSTASVFDWAASTYPVKKRSKMREPTKASYDRIRGLDPDVCKTYGIQLQSDEEGPIRYAFKYPGNTKYRGYDEKKFWFKDKGGSKKLFGPEFNAGTSKRLYLTEGEFDAASLYQILGKTYPVKSIPSASISDKFIKENHEYLSVFEQIVYCGELDHAGKGSADLLYSAYPDKMWFVPMTKHKDANEFLMAGDGEDLKWAALKPQRYSPDNFITSDNEVEEIITKEEPYQSFSFGHEGIDGITRGLVKGGITFIKAPRGSGKCLHPDTPVLLYSGYTIPAEKVKTGDQLMGPDSKPRKVLSTTTGSEEMFKIIPVKGDPWICNRSHILAVYDYDNSYKNISVDDYLKLSEGKKKRLVLYRTGGIKFPARQTIEHDPYFVGMYLGDGSRHNHCITLGPKKESLKEYLQDYVKTLGWTLSEEKMKGCIGYHIVSKGEFKYFKEKMFTESERWIPSNYKLASPENRWRLLAGILDTDGYYSTGCFDIIQKSKQLAKDICFVARSLGLAAYMKPCKKRIKSTGFEGDYYRVSISGDFTNLPCKRHKITPREQIKSVLRTGFRVESLGTGTYCGFEIDGDKLFVLGDFTVTHNTELFRYMEYGVLKNNEDIKIALVHMEEMYSTTYRALATYELGINVRTKQDQEENNVDIKKVVEAALKVKENDRITVFSLLPTDEPIDIVKYCRMAATIYGADFVFIDHIQRLIYRSGAENATGQLTQVATQLAELGKELNIGVIAISHINEKGVTEYARALENEAIICINIERDTDSEDDVERNTTTFVIDKNRPFSKLGYAGKVFYDTETTILKEIE